MRLNCFIASATINQQLPDTCFWGKDPRGAEKVLRSRLQFGFFLGKQETIPKERDSIKCGVCFNGCLGPCVCHLTLPASSSLAEVAITKQTDLQPCSLRLTRWLMAGHPQRLSLQWVECWGWGARGGPTVHVKKAPGCGLHPACPSPAWGGGCSPRVPGLRKERLPAAA